MTLAAVGGGVVIVLVMMAMLLRVNPQSASTLDYYLAGQRVGVVTNASAICGDYFSAASFLGVAAAVYASGLDGVWYATGFAAGFVPVALFVAAPLRRFGEFSIPDFLGRRLESETVRVVAVTVVQLIILSYLMPQAVGSGITWDLLVGSGVAGMSPYATGVVVSTTVITLLVMFGGMRGTTWTQAMQFILMLAILLWLALLGTGAGFDYPQAVADVSHEPLRNAVQYSEGWQLQDEANRLHPSEPARFAEPGARYGRVGQFALVITLVLGTAGLPHVMNRFFTSPTGRAARMTTVWVLGLSGMFYALAVMLGTLARALVPQVIADEPWLRELTVDGVLRVPEHALLVLGRMFAGNVGLGVVGLGALLAVMSTMAGLLLASAASWGHDVYERHINSRATQRQAVWAGRSAVVVAAVVSAAAALAWQPESLSGLFASIVATMVTWSFALAGSALTPVFILAIWWRGTTAAGALAGMASGAAGAVAMFSTGLAVTATNEGLGALLLAPSIISAPVAGIVTVLVSRLTAPPSDVDGAWLIMHGTAADRRAEQLAQLTLRGLSQRQRKRRAG